MAAQEVTIKQPTHFFLYKNAIIFAEPQYIFFFRFEPTYILKIFLFLAEVFITINCIRKISHPKNLYFKHIYRTKQGHFCLKIR